MPEIIYVMTNPAMPDLVKIGKTRIELAARQKELYTTGVPLPFDIHYAAEVDDAGFVESKLQLAFGDHRINPRREFFRIAPEKVVAAIQLAKPTDITPATQEYETPEEAQASEREVQRRSHLRMNKIGVPVGAELVFTRDEMIRAKVVEGSKVEFENEVTSLSASAGKILERMGRSSSVNGADFWKYENETLAERRLRIEEELADQD